MLSRLLFTRRCRSIVRSALAVALLSRCGADDLTPPEPESITLRVQGTVRDVDSGAPISNSKVWLDRGFDRAITRTDATGSYSLTLFLGQASPDCSVRIWDSTYKLLLYAEAEGYAPWSSISAGGPYPRCTSELQTLDVYTRR